MQGRPDSGGDSRDQSGSRHAASLNGTGKTPPASQRSAIPRAGQSSAKPRVSSQLETPRVAHTRRKVARPRKKRFVFLGCLVVFCALFILCGIIASTNLIKALNASSGAATTAAHFLSSLASLDYTQAYKDLSPDITNQLPQDQFIQQGQTADSRYGAIKTYSEVPDSATSQDNKQSFRYTITRTQQGPPTYQNPYEIRIILQSGPDGSTWKIKEYSSALFTPPPLKN
ncbi:MAG: hypothetical protein E6J34_09990 [Chloroflexi bacterium]|nr:MAG: hypothetical protein E6J34_09990 [Chloroflexota bacterium]